MTVREAILQEAVSWPGVTLGPSRVGNAKHTACFRGRFEFAHFHDDTVLDVRVPRREQRAYREDSRARFRKSGSDWMEFVLEGPDAKAAALDLLRLGLEGARLREESQDRGKGEQTCRD